jgi:hypothetical protein
MLYSGAVAGLPALVTFGSACIWQGWHDTDISHPLKFLAAVLLKLV